MGAYHTRSNYLNVLVTRMVIFNYTCTRACKRASVRSDVIEQAWQKKNTLNSPSLQLSVGSTYITEYGHHGLDGASMRERKHGKTEDQFTVAVVKRGVGDTDAKTVVGHLPSLVFYTSGAKLL